MARDEREDGRLPWREREFLTVQLAADVASLSPASIYQFAHDRRLQLHVLNGRTLVRTDDFLLLLATAEMWKPSKRTAPATRKRSERSRAAWEE